MIDKATHEAIEIIKRMDLKIAVPPKFSPPSINKYTGEHTCDIVYHTIHVPSIIATLESEIRQAYLMVSDIKKATAILLNIKKESP